MDEQELQKEIADQNNSGQPPLMDGPIPGQSLTTEPGNRPWENPPQLVSPEEALQFYIPKLTNPENSAQLMRFLKMGIPISAVAEILTSASVMEGKHTIDVSILVTPVLMELIKGLAEISNVDYKMTPKDLQQEPVSDDILDMLEEELKQVDKTEIKEEMEVLEEVQDKAKGLMSKVEK